MAKQKFYAIKEAIDKKTNEVLATDRILTSWPETEILVKGNKADYQSFKTMEEAKAYLSTPDPLMHKAEALYPLNALHCYVDGSFNKDIPNYSFGLTCVQNSKVDHTDYGAGKNKEAIQMQQIGGELLGAMKALVYAKAHGHKEVVIFHDYKGVCYHAIGYWKRDNPFGETYYQWMQKFFKDNPELKVIFCKVDAHTGDEFNEITDLLAKKALGNTGTIAQQKIAEKYGIAI